MTDHNAVRDDVSFLRTLAEDGRDAPLTIGPALFFAGAIFGPACAIAVWGGLSGRITGAFTDPAMFLGAGAAYAAVMWRVHRHMPAPAGAASRANLAAQIAWTAVALAIGAITATLVALQAATHDGRVMLALPPLVLIAYGAAWTMAAGASRQRWLWLVALASFGLAVGMSLLANSPAAFFGLFIAAVFGVLGLPGFILMLQARRAA
jgi:hypothetical protein